jgi:outer membrane protein assembly factor BamD
MVGTCSPDACGRTGNERGTGDGTFIALMMSLLRGSPESGRRLRALASYLALALFVAQLAGCTLFNKDDDYVPDSPADQLYNEGLYLLNNKQDYKAAAKKFDEVDRQNPYSDWARKALLMSAYAYYQDEQYDDCVNSAKRYVTLHPGSPDAAYAQYLIGASYYDQILDVSRDQARADKAIDALEEVVRKYPSSEYAVSAQKKIAMARDQLAGKEMDVGRFYLKKRDFIGAINRFKVVVTQYQTTRHVEEALERLSECYVALGIVDEAQTAAAVLGHNFPDSPWYKDSYTLVKGAGGEPTAENKGSWISRAFQKMGLAGSQSSG